MLLRSIGYVFKYRESIPNKPEYVRMSLVNRIPVPVTSLMMATLWSLAEEANKYKEQYTDANWELLEVAENDAGVHVVSKMHLR